MDRDLIRKSVVGPLRMKAFDIEEGIIKAYITTFNKADIVGDIIAPGAADKFVEAFNKKSVPSLPMLWEHKYDEIIGQWVSFDVDAIGVLGTGELYKGVSKSDDVRIYIEKGAVGSVSIGFLSQDYETIEDTGGRLFKEIEIFETSIVISPANPQAQIVSVKNDDGRIDIRALEMILRDVGFSNNMAKRFISAGKNTLRDEVVEPVETDLRADLINLLKGNSNE